MSESDSKNLTEASDLLDEALDYAGRELNKWLPKGYELNNEKQFELCLKYATACLNHVSEKQKTAKYIEAIYSISPDLIEALRTDHPLLGSTLDGVNDGVSDALENVSRSLDYIGEIFAAKEKYTRIGGITE